MRPPTASANIHISIQDLDKKLISLRETLNGSDLFGILVSPTPARHLVSNIARIFGHHYHTVFFEAFLVAIICIPFVSDPARRRIGVSAIIFCLTFITMMASVRYTGAAHHIVLLYPVPQLLVGLVVGIMRPVWLAKVIMFILIAANVLVVNQYILQLHSTGPVGLFTDAMNPLAAWLSDAHAKDNGHTKTIVAIDLGIRDSLNLLTGGALRAQEAVIDDQSRDKMITMISQPGVLFVARPSGLEYFQGNALALDTLARSVGYQKIIIRTICDSFGRPQFDVFRFIRRPARAW
jgi:hypothetical protein